MVYWFSGLLSLFEILVCLALQERMLEVGGDLVGVRQDIVGHVGGLVQKVSCQTELLILSVFWNSEKALS